jgi:hypothetical protein
VDNVENEDTYLPHLAHAGYELRVRESGHRMVTPLFFTIGESASIRIERKKI